MVSEEDINRAKEMLATYSKFYSQYQKYQQSLLSPQKAADAESDVFGQSGAYFVKTTGDIRMYGPLGAIQSQIKKLKEGKGVK